MEVIERLKKQYGDDLLFVGARGSNCVGLQMEGSDLDILAIVNRQMKKCKELQDDVAVYGLDLADERIMVGAFNLVEALLSPLYIADSYRSLYDKYLEIIFTEEYNYMFRSHLYGAIKNFIKLYYKKDGENRYKHIAKIIMFYKLCTVKEYTESLIEYWSEHKLPEEVSEQYFRIRKYGPTLEEEELIKVIEVWRENSKVKEEIHDLCEYYSRLLERDYLKRR